MYIIGNNKMLEYFIEDDEIKHFYECQDIWNLSNERYAVDEITYYTAAPEKPELGYVEFSVNRFRELTVRFSLSDENLILDASKKISEIHSAFESVGIETSKQIDLRTSRSVNEFFSIENENRFELSRYGLYPESKIPTISIPIDATIDLANESDYELLSKLDNAEWYGIPMLISRAFNRNKDVAFLLRSNGALSGVLCATCNYKNFYDISMICVPKEFNGRNFGTLLANYYARFCRSNNLVPYYGSASGKASERVAEKSGFTEVSRIHGFTIRPKTI